MLYIFKINIIFQEKTKVNSITNVKDTALTLAIDGDHKEVAKALINQVIIPKIEFYKCNFVFDGNYMNIKKKICNS